MRKIISWCLLPFTIWYAVVVVVRNWLFDLNLLQSVSFGGDRDSSLTTICVGNLSCGGTGKTPHVEYLLRLLEEHAPLAVLSRGYKRKSKGFVLDDGSHSAAQLGDEPAMIAAKHADVRVAVCEKRVEGLRMLAQIDNKPNVVVLDDAYQHRYVKPSISILLTDYNSPYCSDYVLPMGDLREPRRGARRANIIVVTKCPENLDPYDRYNVERRLNVKKYQTVYFSYMCYGAMRALYGDAPATQDALAGLTDVVLLTGIANPKPLVQHLSEKAKVTELAFPDHHQFSDADLQSAKQLLEAMPRATSAIIVTEKDAARLMGDECRNVLASLPVYVIPIEVAFHPTVDKSFDVKVLEMVASDITIRH